MIKKILIALFIVIGFSISVSAQTLYWIDDSVTPVKLRQVSTTYPLPITLTGFNFNPTTFDTTKIAYLEKDNIFTGVNIFPKAYVDSFIVRVYALDTGTNITRSILPQLNSLFNLGSDSYKWLGVYTKNLYIDTVKTDIVFGRDVFIDSILTVSKTIYSPTIDTLRSNIGFLVDSIGKHTDSLEVHNNRLNVLADSISSHNTRINVLTDSITSHNTRINTNALNISKNVDSISSHNTRINTNALNISKNVDSISSHNTRINTKLIASDTTKFAYLEKDNTFTRDITVDSTLTIKGAVFNQGNYVYVVGDATTDGSWRFYATLSGDLIYEYRASGIWTEKSRITK